MLLFKKKFLDAIRSGDKTQTIRLWKHCRMRSRQRSYIPGAGYIHVLSVEPIDLEQLTDDDARPDGFATADLLRAELKLLYAEQLAAGQRAYRICFQLFSDDEQALAIAQRKQEPVASPQAGRRRKGASTT